MKSAYQKPSRHTKGWQPEASDEMLKATYEANAIEQSDDMEQEPIEGSTIAIRENKEKVIVYSNCRCIIESGVIVQSCVVLKNGELIIQPNATIIDCVCNAGRVVVTHHAHVHRMLMHKASDLCIHGHGVVTGFVQLGKIVFSMYKNGKIRTAEDEQED
jgi:hypothetical protein